MTTASFEMLPTTMLTVSNTLRRAADLAAAIPRSPAEPTLAWTTLLPLQPVGEQIQLAFDSGPGSLRQVMQAISSDLQWMGETLEATVESITGLDKEFAYLLDHLEHGYQPQPVELSLHPRPNAVIPPLQPVLPRPGTPMPTDMLFTALQQTNVAAMAASGLAWGEAATQIGHVLQLVHTAFATLPKAGQGSIVEQATQATSKVQQILTQVAANCSVMSAYAQQAVVATQGLLATVLAADAAAVAAATPLVVTLPQYRASIGAMIMETVINPLGVALIPPVKSLTAPAPNRPTLPVMLRSLLDAVTGSKEIMLPAVQGLLKNILPDSGIDMDKSANKQAIENAVNEFIRSHPSLDSNPAGQIAAGVRNAVGGITDPAQAVEQLITPQTTTAGLNAPITPGASTPGVAGAPNLVGIAQRAANMVGRAAPEMMAHLSRQAIGLLGTQLPAAAAAAGIRPLDPATLGATNISGKPPASMLPPGMLHQPQHTTAKRFTQTHSGSSLNFDHLRNKQSAVNSSHASTDPNLQRPKAISGERLFTAKAGLSGLGALPGKIAAPTMDTGVRGTPVVNTNPPAATAGGGAAASPAVSVASGNSANTMARAPMMAGMAPAQSGGGKKQQMMITEVEADPNRQAVVGSPTKGTAPAVIGSWVREE
ncbi:hypothetical protein ACFPVT_08115 [Corynebacterium choanae]|uniref:PPE family protein n=1 Tax=Corynebacterium choanae TaxID=1862358 RepID=A0A3G6J848_9CORY|nr:hypothetical protein [Corynebacterium choanae]AZA14079.1 hypothetical protein CCHOA_08450 [Corynebacterium choanae]